MKTEKIISGALIALACSAMEAAAGSDLVFYNGFHTDQDFADANTAGLAKEWMNNGNLNFYPGQGVSVEGTNNSLEVDMYVEGTSFNYQAHLNFTNTFDATLYKSLDFDIHIDPNSVYDANGWCGNMNFSFNAGANNPNIGLVDLPVSLSNGWTHISLPLNPAQSGMNAVTGLRFTTPSWFQTIPPGDIYIYMENMKLVFNNVVPPRPVVAVNTKPLPGLHIRTSTISPWCRGGVGRGVMDWSTASTPVTYGLDIARVPSQVTNPYFCFQFLMSPASTMPWSGWINADYGVDYNTGDVLQMQVVTAPTNGCEVFLTYKINLIGAAGDAFMNGPGELLHYTNSVNPVGHWSLTASNNTTDGTTLFTVTAPNGSQQSAVMNAADAATWQTDKSASGNWGGMCGWWRGADVPWDVALPYQQITNNLGQIGVLGGAYVSTVVDGTNNYSINDKFNGGTDPTTNGWTICDYRGGENDTYYQYPANSAAFTWNTPSSLWQPQVSTSVKGPYTTIPVGSLLDDGVRTAFVPNASMPAGSSGFYRLIYVSAP